MLFTLFLVAMIAGFILLLPITRRLGALMEQRLQEKGTSFSPAEVSQLRAAVDALRSDLERLSERQAFTEVLLEERRPAELPDKPRAG
ncbi:MAG TPA: hypothetical protein VMN39_13125 [Longimicrobiaceae bacterium]|nr:hypothetical protein [Longimicrobiaceae bacterium]